MKTLNNSVVEASRISGNDVLYQTANLSSKEKDLLKKYIPLDGNHYGCDSCNSCGSGDCNSCCSTGDD